ncbi:MAG: 6-phosphofructokinase [Epsilonproteobacteria bacterium]|nr:6-phosphofructokinase [Campylobacterota bacterium]
MAYGIMCSGGDAPGMNPAIKKFVDYLSKLNIEPYFIYDGLEGLIDGKIKKATHKDVAGIITRGGTVIRSSRSKRFFEKKYRQQAYENLKKNGIEALIVLGGDGSFRAMDVFYREFGVKFVGIPSTIDNDIYGTEYCLGVDTALNVIRDSIDKIKDTASSFNRAFVVEVMGRECGYLAAISAMVSGAEVCAIPEVDFDKQKMMRRLQKEFQEGRSSMLAVVAEGTQATYEMKEWIENSLHVETRVSILGHIQRGGSPSVKDRLIAFEFCIKAIEQLLRDEKSHYVIVYNNAKYSFESIEKVVSKKYQIPTWVLESLNYLD